MPYKVIWYDESRSIILFDIRGVITWDGFVVATDQACEMIDSVSNRVDIIFDDQSGMPKGNPFPQFPQCLEKFGQRENLALSVVVAHSRLTSLVESFVDIATRLNIVNTNDSRYVETFQEALSIITEDRAEKSGAASKS